MASSDAKPIPVKNAAYRVTFPIYDADGDLVTGATGLDSEVSKDAGTFADCTNEATEIATSSGVYYLDLTSTEMNADTVCIIIKTSTSGAKTTVVVLNPQEAGDVKVDVETIKTQTVTCAAGVTVGAYVGNATAALAVDASGRVDVSKVAGTSQTARDIGASVLLSSGTGTGQISLASGAVTVGTNNDKTAYALTQSFPTNFASMAITGGGAVTAGTVSDKTGYSLSGTLTTIDSLWTEVKKWFRLLFRSDSSIAADYSTVIADINTNTGSGTGSYDNTQQSVQALHAHAADIEADTNELQVDWTNGGRLDLLLDAVKAKTDNLPASPAATGDIVSAAAIADAVWDEAIGGHSTSGSTGEALSAAGSAGDPWLTALPGAYSAGSAGYILGTNLNATVGSRSSHSAADVWGVATRTLTAFGFTVTTSDAANISAILADTNELQADWADGGRLDLILDARASQASVDDVPTNAEFAARTIAAADYATATAIAVVDGIVDDILVDTGTTLPAQISGLSIPSAATNASAVRTELATELARIDVATSTRLASASYTAPLDAAGTRSAIGLASANLDTQLADMPTVSEFEARTILAASYALETTLTSMKGATFDTSTDSLEALRNRGDAAWMTATGFSTLDAAGVRSAVGLASANLDTQLADLPTVAEFNARTLSAADYATSTALAAVNGIADDILVDTGTTLPAQIAALSIPTTTQIADAVLSRNVSNVEGSAGEHTLCTLVLAGLESSVSGTTWTIKRTDGTTTHVTKTVATDANADPVTGVS